jgi:hypothetical protein
VAEPGSYRHSPATSVSSNIVVGGGGGRRGGDGGVEEGEEEARKEMPPSPSGVPYDAAARLAYEELGGTKRAGGYPAFRDRYEANAVADVISKRAAAAAAAENSAEVSAITTGGGEKAKVPIPRHLFATGAVPPREDVAVAYDAAARLAYERVGGGRAGNDNDNDNDNDKDYAAFRARYEADAISDVISKRARREEENRDPGGAELRARSLSAGAYGSLLEAIGIDRPGTTAAPIMRRGGGTPRPRTPVPPGAEAQQRRASSIDVVGFTEREPRQVRGRDTSTSLTGTVKAADLSPGSEIDVIGFSEREPRPVRNRDPSTSLRYTTKTAELSSSIGVVGFSEREPRPTATTGTSSDAGTADRRGGAPPPGSAPPVTQPATDPSSRTGRAPIGLAGGMPLSTSRISSVPKQQPRARQPRPLTEDGPVTGGGIGLVGFSEREPRPVRGRDASTSLRYTTKTAELSSSIGVVGFSEREPRPTATGPAKRQAGFNSRNRKALVSMPSGTRQQPATELSSNLGVVPTGLPNNLPASASKISPVSGSQSRRGQLRPRTEEVPDTPPSTGDVKGLGRISAASERKSRRGQLRPWTEDGPGTPPTSIDLVGFSEREPVPVRSATAGIKKAADGSTSAIDVVGSRERPPRPYSGKASMQSNPFSTTSSLSTNAVPVGLPAPRRRQPRPRTEEDATRFLQMPVSPVSANVVVFGDEQRPKKLSAVSDEFVRMPVSSVSSNVNVFGSRSATKNISPSTKSAPLKELRPRSEESSPASREFMQMPVSSVSSNVVVFGNTSAKKNISLSTKRAASKELRPRSKESSPASREFMQTPVSSVSSNVSAKKNPRPLTGMAENGTVSKDAGSSNTANKTARATPASVGLPGILHTVTVAGSPNRNELLGGIQFKASSTSSNIIVAVDGNKEGNDAQGIDGIEEESARLDQLEARFEVLDSGTEED